MTQGASAPPAASSPSIPAPVLITSPPSSAPFVDLSKLSHINNARDLCEALPSIAPGRVLRCAKPSDGSADDARVLLDQVGVRDLIDLRATEELLEDDVNSELFRRAAFHRYARGWSGLVRPVAPLSTGIVRHQVSLLDRLRYFQSLVYRMPRRQVARAVASALYDRELSRQVLLKEVNTGGLSLLYQILLDSSKPELLAALNIVLGSAEKQRPVLFFCKAGKDRTGLLAALILSALGASEQQIVADYTKSDAFHMVALAGIEKQEALRGLDIAAFERAPPEAMEGLLRYARTRYGSLVAYMTSIGFDATMQRRLRAALLVNGAALL